MLCTQLNVHPKYSDHFIQTELMKAFTDLFCMKFAFL